MNEDSAKALHKIMTKLQAVAIKYYYILGGGRGGGGWDKTF